MTIRYLKIFMGPAELLLSGIIASHSCTVFLYSAKKVTNLSLRKYREKWRRRDKLKQTKANPGSMEGYKLVLKTLSLYMCIALPNRTSLVQVCDARMFNRNSIARPKKQNSLFMPLAV